MSIRVWCAQDSKSSLSSLDRVAAWNCAAGGCRAGESKIRPLDSRACDRREAAGIMNTPRGDMHRHHAGPLQQRALQHWTVPGLACRSRPDAADDHSTLARTDIYAWVQKYFLSKLWVGCGGWARSPRAAVAIVIAGRALVMQGCVPCRAHRENSSPKITHHDFPRGPATKPGLKTGEGCQAPAYTLLK